MSEVILDNASAHALLNLAAREGLLKDKPNQGDKFLYSLIKKDVPAWHYQQVLEQIVLFPKIHSIAWAPVQDLEGDFFDKAQIEWHQPEKIEAGLPYEVTAEIIDGMLRAKGTHIHISEYAGRIQKAQEALDEISIYNAEHGEEPPSHLSLFIKTLFDKEFRLSKEFQNSERRHIYFQEARPILDCVEEYLALAYWADKNSAFLKTPVYATSDQLINLEQGLEDESQVVKLFRITTSQLGVLPFRNTLRESLDLSKEPATIALREQIPIWIKNLAEGNMSETQLIQNEIKKANESLAKARSASSMSNLTTYISLPVGISALILDYLGALGWASSLVGTFSLGWAHHVNRKYRWATFGSR